MLVACSSCYFPGVLTVSADGCALDGRVCCFWLLFLVFVGLCNFLFLWLCFCSVVVLVFVLVCVGYCVRLVVLGLNGFGCGVLGCVWLGCYV